MVFTMLVPKYTFQLPGNRRPTEWVETTVYENDESTDDETIPPHWKARKKAAREWKPYIERMDKFNSYEIHRFMDAGAANTFADNMSVVKEAQWAGHLNYKNDLGRLAAVSGMHTPNTRIIIGYALDAEASTLGAWLAANTRGDVLTPLRRFLEYIHMHHVGSNKEYSGYELRIFTDIHVAEGYPPDWHADECDGAMLEHAGVLDFEPLHVATCFKGPGTLFMRDRVLSWINHAKEEYEAAAPKDQLKTGELALYRPSPELVDSPDEMFGAIHARPDDEDGERIVVQLMMGTKRQMRGIEISHAEVIERGRLNTEAAAQAKAKSASRPSTFSGGGM
ncbi:uncharacterized protein BKCO1_8400029 [Diplodia corticola]|uniref:Uncharacterized protein n=1 Tax=Diplodia corticola TaxID=236234 RepID=A0A1J9QLH7_9PEZI|nr:uncharacterized protein BKCO1_8400029 [Diplodia corticola]OJD29305.1 hypothetical protein BKCO1_8400029 [Diplodia corticola]